MRFKRSSLLTKILVLVLVVYATVTLVSLESQVAEMNAEAESLIAELKPLESYLGDTARQTFENLCSRGE